MVEGCKIAISTVSMGWHPNHTLPLKIEAAAKYGFQGVEVFITDLTALAEYQNITLVEAACQVKTLCKNHKIEIMGLASLDNFEGACTGLDERLETAKSWIDIAHALGTDIIQIPSNDAKDAIGDGEIIISELRAIADLGTQVDPPIRFAYEAMAWSTHVADWEESLRIIQLVNRENFGICLDTYHILSRIWADPRSYNGRRPGGASALRASLQRFLDTCPIEKIFYVQLSDAEKASPPILPGHEAYSEEKDGTHSWCSWGRVFPYEESEGAYFPMDEICRAWFLEKKFKGCVSLEIFNRKMREEQRGPEHWAERGMKSWTEVVRRLSEDNTARK